MGVFKKKPDPISERARELNAKIASIEAELKRLAAEKVSTPAKPAAPVSGQREQVVANAAPQPRLRSTALPHGPTIHPGAPASPAAPAQEPIFEELGPERLKQPEEGRRPELSPDLGMRKEGLLAMLDKVKTQFRGPATSNPKLVNYLAAGSIQGLRPLRYEKRVARNRFIVLAGALILALWGIVAVLLKHR